MISVIAHRGASAVCRENTVEAFVTAARLGADGVELDVRRSADGALVVHHDAVLPDGRALSNVSVAEIPAWVPLLDAALDACGDLFVNIEVKNGLNEADYDPTESVAADVARLVVERRLQQRTVISSFGVGSIEMARSVDPSVRTGWLTLPGYDQLAALETVVSGGHVSLHPHHMGVTPELVAACHEVGVVVSTWTVDSPDRMLELAALGVDSIITNVPDVALATLRSG